MGKEYKMMWRNVKLNRFYYINFRDETFIGKCVYKDNEALIKFIKRDMEKWHNGGGGCINRHLPMGEDGYYWWFTTNYKADFKEVKEEEELDKIMVELL